MTPSLNLLHAMEHSRWMIRIFHTATRVIVERLHVENCFVFLSDARGGLVLSTPLSAHSEHRPRARQEAQSILARLPADRAVAVDAGARSMLACPLLLGTLVVGALVVQSPLGRHFSAQDIDSLATMGTNLVEVIYNAGLVDASLRRSMREGESSARWVPQAA